MVHPTFAIDLLLRFSLHSLQRRNVGGDEVDGPRAIEAASGGAEDGGQELIRFDDGGGRNATTILAARDDGLLKEQKTKKVVSREQIDERTETEDVKHFGEFTDKVGLR